MNNKNFVKKVLKIFIFNSLILFGSLYSLEFISGYILKNNFEESFSFISERMDPSWKFAFHPSVGHAHKKIDFENSKNIKSAKEFNEIYLVKEYLNNKNENINILSLGGSTTDPLGEKYSGLDGTWPELLSKKLRDNSNNNITLINAGVGGGTSSNELYRLLTILNMKKIDLVISLNGINEIDFDSWEFKNKQNIFGSKMVISGFENNEIHFKNKMFSSDIANILRLNLRNLAYKSNFYKLIFIFRKKTYSQVKNRQFIPKEITLSNSQKSNLNLASSYWLKNIASMRAISKTNGLDYYVFLQPTYGLDLNTKELSKIIIDYEKKNANKKHLVLKNEPITSEYLIKINYLYSLLRKNCSKLDYCFDLSQDENLNNNQNLYSDFRHHNLYGNKIISEKIYSLLKNKLTLIK